MNKDFESRLGLRSKYLTSILQGLLFLVFVALSGCGTSNPTSTATLDPTPSLPPVDVRTTSVPKVENVVSSFLSAWNDEDYEAMYAMLTEASRESIGEEEFIKRYLDVANETALNGVDYEVQSALTSPYEAEVPFRATLTSGIVADISRENSMKLIMENREWRIVWDDSLILPELAGGNYLRMDRETPLRASIYDRNGQPLAAQQQAVAFGIYPDFVNFDEAKGLLTYLSILSGERSYKILGMIEQSLPGAYLPLGEVPADEFQREVGQLSNYGAAVVSEYDRRLYYGSGVAPHVVGYISSIQEDEIDEYRKLGYRSDERVGRKGIELWGEPTLAGKHGGTLYMFNPEGSLVSELGSTPSEPGQDIYTTIDRDFQREAQRAMSIYNGAIVVLERDTGRVLAMVSTPGFNPNAYETDNFNWLTLLERILNNPNNPQFNRASQGQYPLGSVFKLVTIAAALESGRYSPESTYECGYFFEELPDFPRNDWTWDHFQEDGETQPSGLLTLPEGLIKSCNPFFWHIGLDLFNADLTTAIADMSRGFGLGTPTGIEGVDEEAGAVPEPASQVDAINLAIGQGDFLTTPLQVARFVAALGNGGTLYRPQLIEGIAPPGSTITSTFEADPQGTLPISEENLKVIQDAMVGVVRSRTPRGTAERPFRGLEINVAGKTGSATAPVGDSHSWFAGYTFEEREDRPDIAIAVIAENAGEGSDIAAPIFRRIVELYFYDKPLKLYEWEAIFDVTASPTPIVTDTPTPQPRINP